MAETLRILIVEDSLARRIMHRQTLGQEYELLFAGTPLEALTVVAHQRPDLVVLPVRLRQPESARGVDRLDGIDICRMIKRSPLRETPVLLRGSHDGPIDALRARFAGADRYLHGPVEAEALREAIGDLLSPKVIAARLRSGRLFHAPERRLSARALPA